MYPVETVDTSKKAMTDGMANTDKSWLPKWVKHPSLTVIKDNFAQATPARDVQKSKISVYMDNYHIRGKAAPVVQEGFSSVQPKLIRKQAEWRYASLSDPFLSTPDLFTVSPVSWEDREGAIQNSIVLNNQFSTVIDRVTFIDELTRVAVDEGTAIVRVGWMYQDVKKTMSVPQYRFEMVDPEDVESMDKLKMASQGMMYHMPEWMDALEHSLVASQMLKPVFDSMKDIVQTVTVANQPTVEVIKTEHLTIDPTCGGDINRANFLVYTFESSINELTKDSRYHSLEQLKDKLPASVRSASRDMTPAGDPAFNFIDPMDAKFEVHEYWGYYDVHDNGEMVPFVATWAHDILIRMEESPYPDGKFPFVGLKYLPVRGSPYGEPDGALIEDNQKIIGAVTRSVIDIMGRSANAQTGIQRGFIDAVNLRKFTAGQDYEYNPGHTPELAVYTHKMPEIPQTAMMFIQNENVNAESFTGANTTSGYLGQASRNNLSATSVRGALDAASKRELGILRRFVRCLTEVGTKIIAMNAEFLSEREVIRVTNEEFVEVQRDKLHGKYDLRLTISTAEEDNVKAGELAFMLQTVGNTMGPDLTQIILADIARLRKMPDLAKKIQEFVPQPDPYAEMLRELELEKLKADIMERQAHAQERMANAQVRMAEAGTEGAKQVDLQATTTKKQLDIIEQESGVTQERDLQKSRAQAEGNIQLEMAKAILNEGAATGSGSK